MCAWPGRALPASHSRRVYDVLNRHCINSPDMNPNDTIFGQVTGISGTSRNGQLGARVQF